MRVSVVATGIDAEAQGERAAERPKAVPLSLIVSRSLKDKLARQKAAKEPAERPAQPTLAQLTPEAPGAEAETARDDAAAGTGPEAAGPGAAGEAESVSVLPGRGPEEGPKTVPFHTLPAPDHRPTEPPARGTADATRSPGAGATAASASDVVSRDGAQSKPATGEPFGTSPAPAGGAPDAAAGDREVDAPEPPAEPSAAESTPAGDPAVVKMRPASDSTRKSKNLFKPSRSRRPGSRRMRRRKRPRRRRPSRRQR